MPLQKVQFRPGLNREGTDYSNEGGWYDGDKIRFRSGFPEKIGGWQQISNSQYSGVCRSLWVWSDADLGSGNVYIGLGTNNGYFIYQGGIYYNVTPIVQTDSLTNPFTGNGTNIVTITDASYSPNAGDTVYITSSAPVGAGAGWGVDPWSSDSWGGYYGTGVTISGQYTVVSVLSATQYTIAATVPVTGSGGGTVTIAYYYPAGLDVYVTGNGWGAGPWGGTLGTTITLGTNPFLPTSGSSTVVVTQTAHGYTTGNYVTFAGGTTFADFTTAQINNTYQVTVLTANTYTITYSSTASSSSAGGGSSATATKQPRGWGTAYNTSIGQQLRLWTNDNYGADLVLAPRGGPIFYWQDSGGVSTNAKYLSAIANTNTAVTDLATFINAASSITVSAGAAPYIYPFMVISGTHIAAGTQVASTYITGSLTVPITTPTTGISSGNYNFSYAGGYVPTKTYQVISSEIQEFVIAMGANSYTPGAATTTVNGELVSNSEFNPMLVRWSDQANAYQWIPIATNQSGEYLLTNGSYIVGARSTRQEILVWTDSALYSMQYLGAPYVWGFQMLMDNTSIISPNAMITVNNITYWMGVDRFYMYSGRVETLPCALRQYIYADINQSQAYQVFAGSNAAFNEVWWFYVSESSGNTVVDKYVVYNYLDRVWYYGNMNRSAWFETGIVQYPIAADYNNRLVYHENGVDDNATTTTLPIGAYVQSSDFDIGDGHNFGFVWRILPDVNFNGSTTNQPVVTMTVKPRENSGTPYGVADNPQVQSAQNYTTVPEYTIQQFTGQVYTRLRGRQMAFRIESTGQGVTWQLGSPRIDIRPDGRR